MADAVIKERVPPQSIEAEASVLGAMLLDSEALARAAELLDETCFYRDDHRHIFRAIMSLWERGRAADLVTVTEEMRRLKTLDAAGGATYLSTLTANVESPANVEYHARIILEKSVLRKLIQESIQIMQESYDASDDPAEILDRAEHRIFSIRQERIRRGFIPVKSILRSSFELIEELYKKKRRITGLETSFADLDLLTSGFQKQDLIIVAGRPSMGKTSFALNVAQHAAIVNKIPTAIFSLETSKAQLVQRMLCSEARVDNQRLRTGYLSQSDWPRLTTAAGLLSPAPIYIDDSPSMTVLEMRTKARRLKSEVNLGLIVIDYMQMISASRRAENRQQEMSEISRSLKALAKEIDVPVIACSQLSRAVESRQDRRPVLSDLRESGAIEQDADIVLFIYRAERYGAEQDKGIAEVIVGKQRNGPVGTVKLTFIKEYTRFENYTSAVEDWEGMDVDDQDVNPDGS
jgi:replicative DNA helicase